MRNVKLRTHDDRQVSIRAAGNLFGIEQVAGILPRNLVRGSEQKKATKSGALRYARALALSAQERKIDSLHTNFFRFPKTPPMDGDENFWLHLTRMADSYQASGSTPAERAAEALMQFNELPPAVQREVLVAMRSAVTELADLYAVASAKTDGAGLGSERRGKSRAR